METVTEVAHIPVAHAAPRACSLSPEPDTGRQPEQEALPGGNLACGLRGRPVGAVLPPAGPPRRPPAAPSLRRLPRARPTLGAGPALDKSLGEQEQQEQHCGSVRRRSLHRPQTPLPSEPSCSVWLPLPQRGTPPPLPTSLSETPSCLLSAAPRGSHFPSLSATLWLPSSLPASPDRPCAHALSEASWLRTECAAWAGWKT